MSWLCRITCLCTTTPSTGAELEDWTPQKGHRPTWNTVLKTEPNWSRLCCSSFCLFPLSLVLACQVHHVLPLIPSNALSFFFFLSLSCFLPWFHFPLLLGLELEVSGSSWVSRLSLVPRSPQVCASGPSTPPRIRTMCLMRSVLLKANTGFISSETRFILLSSPSRRFSNTPLHAPESTPPHSQSDTSPLILHNDMCTWFRRLHWFPSP